MLPMTLPPAGWFIQVSRNRQIVAGSETADHSSVGPKPNSVTSCLSQLSRPLHRKGFNVSEGAGGSIAGMCAKTYTEHYQHGARGHRLTRRVRHGAKVGRSVIGVGGFSFGLVLGVVL